MRLRICENKLFLYDPIEAGDGAFFAESFNKLDRAGKTIELHLHTPGGSVFEGNLIANLLRESKASVDIYIDGLAASMGAIIMLTGRKIYMAENAFLMIHGPSCATLGGVKDHKTSAKLLEEMERLFIKQLSGKTGKTQEEIQPWLGSDHWFSAQEALNEGLIDKIVSPLVALKISKEDLSSEKVYGKFAALLEDIPKKTISFSKTAPKEIQMITTTHDTMKQILSALALDMPAEPSQELVVEAIKEKINHYKNLSQEQRARADELQKQIDLEKENRLSRFLDKAVQSGKIPSAKRALYEQIGKKSGLEAIEALLEESAGAYRSITAQIAPLKSADQSAWSWDDFQEKDPKAIDEMRSQDKARFEMLYKEKYGTQPI